MTRRILVVDDEPSICELLADVLTSSGFEVDLAGDAARALELIRQNIYDAAILDFNLPDMNGVMLHREIRQIDAELSEKTLFTSGQAQGEDDLSYFSSFGQGFVAKPFDPQHVLDVLSRLWRR